MKCALYILFVIIIQGCGPETNIFSLTLPESYKDSFDYHYSLGLALYDAGDYEEAVVHAEKAWQQNNNSEEAAALLGFCQLALAGVTPFQLANQMITSNTKEKEDAKKEAEAEAAEGEEEAKAGGNTGDTLSSISDAIGFTEEEIAKLGTLDTQDPELPVIVPACAANARELSQRLTYVNRAIAVICPFVDEELKQSKEYRHNCNQVPFKRSEAGKAHFLWAFAHLTEAIAFNKVLNYGKGAEGKTNLEKRVDKVKGKTVESPEEIDQFISEFNTIQSTVDKVMPTTGLCSDENPQTQLEGLLNDLVAVSKSFNAMSGMPKAMVESITAATADIVAQRENLGEEAGGGKGALKGDLNGKISSSLGGKIDELTDGDVDFSEDQKQTLCSGFNSISGGSEEDKPKICT